MTKSKALFFALSALAAVLLPLCAYLRISTCSTGADPQIFISLALDILDHRFAEVAAFVVPGWPLYLAAVIHLFGPFAACWANVPLFVLLVFALWILLSDLLASRTRAALAALFSAIALLAGSGHNPHFLLWAFRQTPIYLASLLSLLFVRRATRAAFDSRPRAAFAWLLASLAAALAATLVRETSALLLPVLFLHLLLDSGAPASLPPSAPLPPFRRRLPLLFAFCALNLAALLAGLAAVFALHLNVFNSQNLYILRSLEPLLRDHLLSASHMSRSLALVLGEFPWLLGLCLLLGVLAACARRRFRPFATLFLVPALLNFLFEAFHKIHMRFFLTPVFYLAPLAALGAFVLFDALRRLLARRRPAARAASAPSLKLSFVLLALLAVWAAFVVRSMLPWGPRVSPAQVRQCLQAIDAASPAPDALVLLDPKSRYLREILHLFSPRKILDVTPETLAFLDLSSPALFIRPLDREAFHSSVLALDATQLLEFHANLRPLAEPDDPADIRVGDARHRFYLVSAPTATSVDLPLPPPPALAKSYPYPSVFLRIGAPLLKPGVPLAAALVRASNPSAPVLLSSSLQSGFNDLPVPVSLLSPGEAFSLRLSSPEPFPVTLPVSWNEPDALHYEFGLFMYPRHDILSPEFHVFDDLKQPDPPFPTWPVGARTREFDKPGTIELPAAFDGHTDDAPPVPSIFYTDFLLSAVHSLPGESLTATVSFPDVPSIPPQSVDIPALSVASHISFSWANLPSNRLPPRLRLELPAHPRVRELYPHNRRSSSSRIHSMDLKRIPLSQGNHLAIRFGDPDDGTFLLSGFHHAEHLHTPRQGRWLADRADMVLPLVPAAYLLSMDVDLSTLPAPLRASRPSDFSASLDETPIPLAFAPLDEPGETHLFRVTATIPASAFSADGIHHLRFSAPPFRPADFGQRDSRALALFARSLSLTPAP